MPRTQRPRREVSPVTLAFARPLFRYSYSRDAFVLRAVGNTRGPVLRASSGMPAPTGIVR